MGFESEPPRRFSSLPGLGAAPGHGAATVLVTATVTVTEPGQPCASAATDSDSPTRDSAASDSEAPLRPGLPVSRARARPGDSVMMSLPVPPAVTVRVTVRVAAATRQYYVTVASHIMLL